MSSSQQERIDMIESENANEPEENPAAQEDAPAQPEESKEPEEACCDGERTAAEHRHESADGKCCVDG